MFSDIFYLSSLLNLSLAFNEKEKLEIFRSGKNNAALCANYIGILEKEVSTLASFNEERKKKLNTLNEKTVKKIGIVEEVQYADAMKKRLDEIKNKELSETD